MKGKRIDPDLDPANKQPEQVVDEKTPLVKPAQPTAKAPPPEAYLWQPVKRGGYMK